MKVVHGAWHWLMGDLPHFDREITADWVIWWVGIAVGMGMIFGEFHNLGGPPIPKGFWRLAVHGVLSFSAVALITAHLRNKGKGFAVFSLVVILCPILYRIAGSGAAKHLKTEPVFLAVPTFLALALALGAFHKSGEPLSNWGISFGDWRWWVPRILLGICIVVPGVYLIMANSPELTAYYPTWKPARRDVSKLVLQQMGYGLDLLGWEFLFRGVLLFGFARRGDPVTAIWIQCFPFFLLHYHKPYIELFTSFWGGLLSGWFCLRARSFLPLFLLHWVQISAVSTTGFLLRQ